MENMNKPTNSDDFEAQREYLENLSHELLTPLAVIQNEAELLLQSANIAEADLHHIDKIVVTVNRLAQINKGLILLSKIHHGIYIDREEVDICNMVDETLLNFENQIELKELELEIIKEGDVLLETSNTLISILITNELKNAIMHNLLKGKIKIVFSKNKITITNTGKVGIKNPKELFNRFVSDRDTSNTIGLGLSIMKRISDHFNYVLEYTSMRKIHTIKLTF
jgi:signal transduction histidine kinase